MTTIRPETRKLLTALSCIFPTFHLDPEQAQFWDGFLRRFTGEELDYAVREITKNPNYGNPTAALVVQAIDGVTKEIRIHMQGNQGGYLNRSDGSAITEPCMVSVGLDGVPRDPRYHEDAGVSAAQIEAQELPPKLVRLEAERQARIEARHQRRLAAPQEGPR